VTLLRTDVSEKRIASIIRVTRIGEPGTTLADVIFEFFTAVNMNCVFWDVMQCGSCKSRRFRGT
jgi:hypothetical protein